MFSRFLIYVIIYILYTYPLYVMAKKANMRNPECMFIPIINGLKLFNLANKRSETFVICFFLMFIPIVNFFVAIYLICVYYKLFKNFGLSDSLCFLGIFFSIFVFWYIAIDDSIKYVGEYIE